MTEDFNYITSRGLPGGPNQEITYVTGVVSVEGYRYDSPDKNNSVNLIDSGDISMSENDGTPLKKGPLLGIDNLGNKEIMVPGTNYSFAGDQVLEIPMAQKGNGEFRDFKGIPFLSSIAAGDFANHQHHNSRLADLYRYYSGRPLEDNIIQVSNNKPTKAKDSDVKYISLNKNQQLVQEVIDNYNRVSNGNFYTTKTRPDLILDADDDEKQLDKNNYKVTGYREVDNIDDYQLNAIGNYFTGFGEDENGTYISYYDKFDQAGGIGGDINFGEILGLTKPFEIYDRIYVEKDKESGKYIQKKKGGGSVSWNWKGKSYSGTLIPSMENEKNRYARTKNGKIKTLPKGQEGEETEKSSLSKWGHGILDAAGLVPGFGEIADGINAAWYAAEGDNVNAALSTAAMVPFFGWGATATKGILKGVKGTKNIAKEAIENTVKVADDVKPRWSRGVTNYGRSPEGIQDALSAMKAQGKYLDEIGFNVDDVIAPNVINHGNKYGRQIAEVALPNGQSQLFYKSSGLAGKKGAGKTGTTEGLWQPYGGHASIGTTDNWFIKDAGYENFYDSNSFKAIANKLDEIESGWDMSKQVLKSKLKYGGGKSGSTTNPYTIYINYINGVDNSDAAKNIFDKLNRIHYKDAKKQGMGVANYIATNFIDAS